MFCNIINGFEIMYVCTDLLCVVGIRLLSAEFPTVNCELCFRKLEITFSDK